MLPKDNLINVYEDKIDDYFFPMLPPKKRLFKITSHSLSLSAGNMKGKVIVSWNQLIDLISYRGYPVKSGIL